MDELGVKKKRCGWQSQSTSTASRTAASTLASTPTGSWTLGLAIKGIRVRPADSTVSAASPPAAAPAAPSTAIATPAEVAAPAAVVKSAAQPQQQKKAEKKGKRQPMNPALAKTVMEWVVTAEQFRQKKQLRNACSVWEQVLAVQPGTEVTCHCYQLMGLTRASFQGCHSLLLSGGE